MNTPEGKEDFEVVIVDSEGDYLYRDGKSKGPDRVRACKYMYHGDKVEEQLTQVKQELGVSLRWEVYEV